MIKRTRLPIGVSLLAITFAIAVIGMRETSGYVLNGPSWAPGPVLFRVNTTNLDLPDAVIPPALIVGADAWSSQTNAAFRFQYDGTSTVTSNTFDSLNVVMFRNASSGSAIATAYWWSSGSRIIDADIVFWDGAFQFFTGSTGCSNGFYIEDIAAHEFGHALGLGHSAITGATMAPSVSSCASGNRSLHADDIAGVEALYPPSLPTAPAGLRLRSGIP
jgi:matrix metalloproteinase-14 (membrane-inserted)